jgi:hypothetical protein
MPRRNRGRWDSSAPLSLVGGEGLDSLGLDSWDFAGGAEEGGDEGVLGLSGGNEPGLAESGPVEPGPDELGPEEPGTEDGGVVGALGCDPALGGVAAGGLDDPRVRRGGPSLLSMPIGTVSALWVVFATSVPVGTHVPVAIHGADEYGDVLCNAPPIVNNPSELPVRVPSYTMPESSAIGIGSAL